jgi:iron complex outermembrane recepter protein
MPLPQEKISGRRKEILSEDFMKGLAIYDTLDNVAITSQKWGQKMAKFNKVSQHRAGLVSSVALPALLILGATNVHAQATVQPPTSVSEQPAVAENDSGVEVVIVTAQRREESLQKVPLSVVAITGRQLRDADIRDVTRLEQSVPGLRIARSGAAARPAIRGVYTEAIAANSDPRIGFYIDEVYQSRLQQTTAAFVDLARVEVQKGPQGTLFGRNSLGGNIALTSAKPTDKFEYGAALILGDYSRSKVEGFVNFPISEGLAVRIAAAVDKHDPYYDSVVNERASIGDLNYQFVRGTLRFAPPSMGDRLEVVVRASVYKQDDRGLSSFNAKNIGAVVDSSLIRQPGQSVTFNGATYPMPFGYNGGNYATGVLVPFSPVFRDGIADSGGVDLGIPIPGQYKILHDFPAENVVDAKNVSAVINFDLTENIRLRSITAYTDFFTSNRSDGDGSPIPFSEFYFITATETFSQELQLQSANPDSPLQYTIGAFYMTDDISEGQGTVFSGQNYSTITAAANGQPVLYANGGGCGYTASPLFAPFSCNINNATSADGASPVAALTESWAAYAQASYAFNNKLTLTAGARYTVDDKTYKSVAQVTPFTTFVGTYVAAENAAAIAAGRPAPFPNTTGYRAVLPYNDKRADFANFECGGLTPGTFAAVGSNQIAGTVPNYFVTRCGQREFKYWTYRLAADYQLTPNSMIYASYSTGIHSGGFGSPFITTTTPQGEFGTFDAESVRAFEIGSKNTFFDRRLQLNAAVFYNEYSDNQVQGTQFVTTGPNTGVNIATITNSGDTIAPGGELSFIARPNSQLTIRGSINYLHARNTVAPLGIFTSGLCTISTGSGPCVTNPVESRAGLGSGFFPNPFTNPELFVPIRNAAGVITGYDSLFFGEKTRVQNTPDWSGALGAAYEIELGNGSTITPEFDLLFSGDYLLSASTPNVLQKAYSKLDVRVTFRTEAGLSVQGYVQNATDEATLGRITTGTLSAQGTYSDPRTYGVRLGYKF